MADTRTMTDNILGAMQTLIDNSISRLNVDKTVVATINKQKEDNKYILNYNGGQMTATSNSTEVYESGTKVYVLIPQGDFSKEKVIVSKITGDTDNIVSITESLGDYSLVGKNLVERTENVSCGDSETVLHCFAKDNQPSTGEDATAIGVCSCKPKCGIKIYDIENEQSEETKKSNLITIDQEQLKEYINNSDALLLAGSFKTSIPQEYYDSTSGRYYLIFSLDFNKPVLTPEEAEEESYDQKQYLLDSLTMTGDSLKYNNYNKQFEIFDVDTENFVRVNQIFLYAENFVENDSEEIPHNPDIWVKDIQIQGLKLVTAINGDYKLKVNTPQGAKLSGNNSSVLAKAQFSKLTTDLSSDDESKFYWFKKDSQVVNAGSDGYNKYGGIGWKLEEDNCTNQLTISSSDCHSYKNSYKCVVVYNSMSLSTEFIVWRDGCPQISLMTNLPLYDQVVNSHGTIQITTNISNETNEDYSYYWSITTPEGTKYIFSETYAELKAIAEGQTSATISEQIAARNKLNMYLYLENVSEKETFDPKQCSTIEYESSKINSSMTFGCEVYTTSQSDMVSIGEESLTIYNKYGADATDTYKIIIENGDQCFQYTQAGISPVHTTISDPIVIQPLSTHFYDPLGIEIDKSEYSIQWFYPTTDNTLLVVPTEELLVSIDNEMERWAIGETHTPSIKEEYDYQAIDNQIRAVITYKNQIYKQLTNFSFIKQGENGTNGSDIAVVVVRAGDNPLDPLVCTLGMSEYISLEEITEQLETRVYNQSTRILDVKVLYSIAGTSSKIITLTKGSAPKGKLTNLIIKATVAYNSKKYYAFYPVIIVRTSLSESPLKFNINTLLRTVLYDSTGYFPQYNQSRASITDSVTIPEDWEDEWTWKACGGDAEDATTASFSLVDKDNKKVIVPKDYYSGEYMNNFIYGCHKDSESQTIDYEVFIPIYMSLNTHSLYSLDAWDGNTVEIDDAGGYVLAPQIGAGEKDENNKFTGVLLGTQTSLDATANGEEEIGFFGYSGGKRSMFLNAQDGSATFGLASGDSSQEESAWEGQIVLQPNGTSRIGNWRIGSTALYNIPDKNVNIKHCYDERNYSIPPETQGILLNAENEQTYLSIKGRALTVGPSTSSKSYDIDNTDGKTALKDGDSLEVELYPNSKDLFSIYRHHCQDEEWTRSRLVGIDTKGRFYSNAVAEDGTSMTVNKVVAFGKTFTTETISPYRGLDIGVGKNNDNVSTFIKIFTEPGTKTEGVLERETPVYISGSCNADDEYERPLKMYGKSLSLYAFDGSTTIEDLSNSRITVDENGVYLGHPDITSKSEEGTTTTSGNYFSLNYGTSQSKLKISSNNFCFINQGSPSLLTTFNLDKFTIKQNDILDWTIGDSKNKTIICNYNESTEEGSSPLPQNFKIDATASLKLKGDSNVTLTGGPSEEKKENCYGELTFNSGGFDLRSYYCSIDKETGQLKFTSNAYIKSPAPDSSVVEIGNSIQTQYATLKDGMWTVPKGIIKKANQISLYAAGDLKTLTSVHADVEVTAGENITAGTDVKAEKGDIIAAEGNVAAKNDVKIGNLSLVNHKHKYNQTTVETETVDVITSLKNVTTSREADLTVTVCAPATGMKVGEAYLKYVTTSVVTAVTTGAELASTGGPQSQ